MQRFMRIGRKGFNLDAVVAWDYLEEVDSSKSRLRLFLSGNSSNPPFTLTGDEANVVNQLLVDGSMNIPVPTQNK